MRPLKGLAFERELAFAEGELIVREGDPGREMYIIRAGAVVISKQMGGREVVLARLGRGEFFGEMSLLESLPREADARAVAPAKLLVISPGGLLARIRRDPTFALEMIRHLSGRLRASNAELAAALTAAGDREAPHDH